MRVAFYAPMKAPDHPVPSGDRQMARLILAALDGAGHEVEVVSTFRSFLAAPDTQRQNALRAAADLEVARVARDGSLSDPPDLWFTYHNHYKAPDLLGPSLAARFGLPYAMAEASHAPRRAAQWGPWHEAAEHATRSADLHVCFTCRDRDGIAPLLKAGTLVRDLPPFIDGRAWTASDRPPRSGPVRIATVAMMRQGDKLDSYRLLAAALAKLDDLDWTLAIVGDGPARAEVEAAFRDLPARRIRWCGGLPAAGVAAEMAGADLLAWPGLGEAFGLSYLEAQAAGLPVVALDVAGVASVVRHERTGLLADEATPIAFAHALRRLVADPALRRKLGTAAAAWVRDERSLATASVTLNEALAAVVSRSPTRHG